MALDRIELILLRLPYVHPFETSLGRETERTFILVKVSEGGLSGYGEVVAGLRPHYSYETTDTAWLVLKEYLAPLAFQQDLCRPEDFAEAAARYRGHPMAKAGLELALWDLEARRRDLPLSAVYGGTRTEIAAGVSVGIQDSDEALVDRIAGFIEEGYRRVKIKIKPGWDVEICRKVRRSFPDLPLQVDANGAYAPEDTPRLKSLDGFSLAQIEQPFPPYDLWDHAKLQRELETPLCLDESAVSLTAVRQALEMGSCRIVNIKVGRVGGPGEALKIHEHCRRLDVPVWCGGMLESGIGRAHNLHLASLPGFTLPNDLSASRRYYREDLIDPPFEMTGEGMIPVPTGPGIGVEPVEDRVLKASLGTELLRP